MLCLVEHMKSKHIDDKSCCIDALLKFMQMMAVVASLNNGIVEVPDHPLIRRVRQCSAHPEEAAHFFTHLFSPWPFKRLTLETLYHPYILDTGRHLEAAFLKEAGRPITVGCIGIIPFLHGCTAYLLQKTNPAYNPYLIHSYTVI